MSLGLVLAPPSSPLLILSRTSSGDATSPAPMERSLQEIAMVTPTVGYALFETALNSSATKCGSWVARTANGGRTFSTPAPVTTWTNCRFVGFPEHLTANAEGDVFVWGNGLHESYDDGSIWEAVALRGRVEQIAVQGSSAWLVSERCRTRSELTCPLVLEISPDGGRSWSPDPAQPPVLLAENGPLAATTTLLLRVNRNLGYAFTAPRSQRDQAAVLPVWETSNGGRTWHARHTRCSVQPAAGVPFASATRPGAIYLLCANPLGEGYGIASVSVSYDGARTWKVVNPPSKPPNEPLSIGYPSSIAALNDTTAFVTGIYCNLYVTHDAGRTWSVLPYGYGGGGPQQISFVNARDGFMLASSPSSTEWLYDTVDGGAHWSRIIPKVE